MSSVIEGCVITVVKCSVGSGRDILGVAFLHKIVTTNNRSIVAQLMPGSVLKIYHKYVEGIYCLDFVGIKWVSFC